MGCDQANLAFHQHATMFLFVPHVQTVSATPMGVKERISHRLRKYVTREMSGT
jgi:hypothetical protein